MVPDTSGDFGLTGHQAGRKTPHCLSASQDGDTAGRAGIKWTDETATILDARAAGHAC